MNTINTNNIISSWVSHFCSKGLALHWLHPKSKIPVGNGWQNKPVPSEEELMQEYRSDYNLGFRPGIPSTIDGKHIIVLDVDIKSDDPRHRSEAMTALRKLIGEEMQPTVMTGGGGCHIFMYCAPEDLPTSARPVLVKSGEVIAGKQRPAWAIELLSTGSNCVLPPSVHPETGKGYEYQKDALWLPEMPPLIRERLQPRQSSSNALSGLTPETRTILASRFGNMNVIPETEENIQKMQEALSVIPPCLSYPDWIRVLFAVRAHGWTCGETLARQWSATCIENYEEAAFSKAWNSDRAGEKGGALIGSGTLYHMAKEYGPETDAFPDDAPHGDTTNARWFAHHARGWFLFCHSNKKWLRWNGMRWQWCEQGEEMEMAKWVADQGVRAAAQAFRNDPSGSRPKEMLKAAQMLHGNKKRMTDMLDLTVSEEGMSIASQADLDKDPMLLGVKNGVIALDTGVLLEANRDWLISKQAHVDFDPDATCPKFLKLLDDIFGGDTSVIDYIQRALGYTLTGLVDEEVLFFMYGSGANGKSVLANIISGIMGDYAVSAQADMLSKRPSNANAARGDVARLAGARLVLANETRHGDVWDDQLVKVIVSREQVTARFLYGEPFSFFPTHKLWVRGNHKPGIQDDGDGMWRRVHLIGFDHQIPEDQRIPDLDRQILREEGSGVLNWMLHGVRMWREQKLSLPEKLRKLTAQYRDDSDLIGEWLDEECELGVDFSEDKRAVYSNFSQSCKDAGIRLPPSQKALSRRLSTRGIGECYKNGRKAYAGIKLKRPWLAA